MPSSVFLIVVDNPAHRVLLNRYLGSTGHHLVYATDGEDGFDRYSEVKPDLVMIYAHVSRLDGTILCQLIRQQPTGEVTPIVMLTDEASNRSEGWATGVGADAMLRIPFDRPALLRCIAPLLASGRPPQPERPSTPPPVVGDAGAPTEVLGEPLINFPEQTAQRPSSAPGKQTETDLDTVVSFQNPFHEGGAAVVDPTIGESEESTPGRGQAGVKLHMRDALPTMPPEDRADTPSESLPIHRPPALEAPPMPDPLEEPQIAPATHDPGREKGDDEVSAHRGDAARGRYAELAEPQSHQRDPAERRRKRAPRAGRVAAREAADEARPEDVRSPRRGRLLPAARRRAGRLAGRAAARILRPVPGVPSGPLLPAPVR